MRYQAPLGALTLLVTVLAMPSTGLAAKKKKPRAVTRTLAGQVVGTPLPSGSRSGVPVLLDAASVRRAKLRTPLAFLKIPRAARVRVPGNQRIGLDSLRAGDVFSARVRVVPAMRRASLPAMNVGSTAFTIRRRGTALSPAELQAQIGALTGYVGALTGYVISQFADLRGQVAGLRNDLNGLSASLASLQARVTQVESSLQTQLTTLIERVSTLETQLGTLTTQVTQLTGDLAAVQNLLSGVAPGDLAGMLTDVATLQTVVGGIDVESLETEVSSLAAKIGTVGATDLQTQIDQANSALADAQAQLSFLCSANLLKVGLLPLGSCPS